VVASAFTPFNEIDGWVVDFVSEQKERMDR
jgi:hypothetical protein